MNLPYLIPRLARHFLPEKIVRFLLRRSLVIQPGLETTDPGAAVQRYVDLLAARGDPLGGKRVMIFGYGGRFDIGVGLLEAGAGSVVLCEDGRLLAYGQAPDPAGGIVSFASAVFDR